MTEKTMNVELLGRIADWLEAGAPHAEMRGMKFDMGPMIKVPRIALELKDANWCGTACCIAGAAVTLHDPQLIFKASTYPGKMSDEIYLDVRIWNEAEEVLGLVGSQAADLFAPFDQLGEDEMTFDGWPDDPDKITPAWAARVIRNFIATGVVEWNLAEEVAQ